MEPLVCASLVQETPDAMAEASAHTSADLVEARLDALQHLDAATVTRLPQELQRPAIATLRPTTHGGSYDGPEATRTELLSTALEAPYVLVDVERDAPGRDELLDHAVHTQGRVLLSHHDRDGTPHLEDALEFAREAHDMGAWGAKLATTIRDARDAAVLVEATRRAHREGLRLATMGINDPILRLAAPGLRQPLTYASLEDGEAAAAGQVPVPLVKRVHGAFREPSVSADTRLLLLLGHPVDHSLSPAMQTAALHARGVDAVYLAADVPAEGVGNAVQALRTLDVAGANVTAPHKEAVLQHVDGVTPTVEASGTANTLVVEEGQVLAHNTDGAGTLQALRNAGVEPETARCLVLGAGGAARAIAHALAGQGADVTVANRTRGKARSLAKHVAGTPLALDDAPSVVEDVDVVLNCTSLGHHGDDTPIDPTCIPGDVVVFDAVYRRGGTPLLQGAREQGCTVVPGEELLLHQGAEAFRLWTREDPPVAVMRRVLEDHLEVSAWRATR